MFGFIVAGASALGLVYLGRGGHRGRWARMGLHRVLSRLDASPAQERVIREAVAKVREAAQDFAEEARSARSELGTIAAANEFSEAQLDAWFDAREQSFAGMRPVLSEAFRQIHEVLDTQQRQEFARMLSKGPFRHRGHAHHHQNCRYH